MRSSCNGVMRSSCNDIRETRVRITLFFFLFPFCNFELDIIKVMFCFVFFVLRSSKVLSFNFLKKISNRVSIKAYKLDRNIALRASISYSQVGSLEPLILKKMKCKMNINIV